MAQSIERLVERQIGRWRVLSQLASEGKPLPSIAFSRFPGSAAVELGLRVAERLGWEFYGIELLDRIARERGIAPRLLEGLDERVRSAIERQVVDAMGHPGLTESEYLHHMIQTITTLGERGGCVLFGRGSHLILSPERTLRVLVVAPRGVRAERLARRRGVPAAEGSSLLAGEETAREEFFRHHFGRDPNDPSLFDIVLNTGTLSLDACADLVLAALRARFPGHRLALPAARTG